MSIEQFKSKIREARYASEVEWMIHAYFPLVSGTGQELWHCLQFAFDQRMALVERGSAEGDRGCCIAQAENGL